MAEQTCQSCQAPGLQLGLSQMETSPHTHNCPPRYGSREADSLVPEAMLLGRNCEENASILLSCASSKASLWPQLMAETHGRPWRFLHLLASSHSLVKTGLEHGQHGGRGCVLQVYTLGTWRVSHEAVS